MAITTSNEELKELIQMNRVLLNRIVDEHKAFTNQMITLIELIAQGYKPPPDEHTPLFSSGEKGTRRVQMTENTRVRIAKVKDGVVQFTETGNLKFWKPIDGIRLFRGDVHVVWRPYVQGDGDRLWEMYEYPGRFIKNRHCSFV